MDERTISFKTKLVAVAGIAFLLVVGLLLVGRAQHSKKPMQSGATAKVSLLYTNGDPSTATVRFDGKVITGSGTPPTYRVPAGTYTLTVEESGYDTFKTSFSTKAGDQLSVTVALKLVTPPTPLQNTNQISIPGAAIPGLTLVSEKYFYENTWAVLGVQAEGGDIATLVAKFDPAEKSWIAVAGPGTVFSVADLQGMPTGVQNYLMQSGIVNVGSGGQ
jgi:PEGA domain-containing protein